MPQSNMVESFSKILKEWKIRRKSFFTEFVRMVNGFGKYRNFSCRKCAWLPPKYQDEKTYFVTMFGKEKTLKVLTKTISIPTG